MGKNRFENFVFASMVCFAMVFGMTIYNTILTTPAGGSFVEEFQFGAFLCVFALALVLELIFVSPIVRAIVKKVTNEKTPFIRKIMTMSLLMIFFMCTMMSLIATLFQGYEGSLLDAYTHMWMMNIVVALPLQIFIIGPIIRKVFFTIFPIVPPQPVEPSVQQEDCCN
ncbi:DUF2798 domain-containing protein [Shewanella youngdeokensis]|uniref:DUF2798 domain-containing protein n=1 Tax=Shewanella youngdeokensis TaxID=2999068 RepID=A0ABZ0K3T5_9GAMM|nr:DUF2798 domain-containing protein [Shewanella sp. DAU334]